MVVIALTSNVRLAHAPGNVLLAKRSTGLPETSVANVSRILTLDKSMLVAKAGALSPDVLQKVDAGLKLVLQV